MFTIVKIKLIFNNFENINQDYGCRCHYPVKNLFYYHNS